MAVKVLSSAQLSKPSAGNWSSPPSVEFAAAMLMMARRFSRCPSDRMAEGGMNGKQGEERCGDI